jgi:hypothetical protein
MAGPSSGVSNGDGGLGGRFISEVLLSVSATQNTMAEVGFCNTTQMKTALRGGL